MVGATILLLTPAVARIFLLFTTSAVRPKALGVQPVVLVGCMAYDVFTRTRVHLAWIWSTLAFLLFVFAAILGGTTRAWLAIAHLDYRCRERIPVLTSTSARPTFAHTKGRKSSTILVSARRTQERGFRPGGSHAA
jgi:hypothetical protein